MNVVQYVHPMRAMPAVTARGTGRIRATVRGVNARPSVNRSTLCLLFAVASCGSKPDPTPVAKPVTTIVPVTPDATAPPVDATVEAAAVREPATVDAAPVREPAAKTPSYKQTALHDKHRTNGGQTWTVGDRVTLTRTVNRGLDPDETKQQHRLDLTTGRTGTIVGFARRVFPQQQLDLEVVLVKWDAQTWTEKLPPPFERMKEGKSYSSEEINAMNAEVGPEIKVPSFVAGLFYEELR